jgi:acyl-CoA thioester hydrolase
VNTIATASHKCATVRTIQVALREDRSRARPWTDDERATLNTLLIAAEK